MALIIYEMKEDKVEIMKRFSRITQTPFALFPPVFFTRLISQGFLAPFNFLQPVSFDDTGG